MNNFIVFFLILGGLSMILVLLGMMLSQKFIFDREKSSPFECGFTPKSLPRMPLSLRFFLIAIVFLIFDVELVMMFPYIILLMNNFQLINIYIFFSFLILLSIGLYHEINQGSLSWAK